MRYGCTFNGLLTCLFTLHVLHVFAIQVSAKQLFVETAKVVLGPVAFGLLLANKAKGLTDKVPTSLLPYLQSLRHRLATLTARPLTSLELLLTP